MHQQLLNLTQHIEDGYQNGMITCAVFVDLSAVHDTVNHMILIRKLYNKHRTVNYVEISRICCPTMSVADGEYRKTACPSYCFSTEVQRQTIIKSGMEQDRTG